jgi:hypothetical protein
MIGLERFGSLNDFSFALQKVFLPQSHKGHERKNIKIYILDC